MCCLATPFVWQWKPGMSQSKNHYVPTFESYVLCWGSITQPEAPQIDLDFFSSLWSKQRAGLDAGDLWRRAPVGQEFQPKTMLFEATVGMMYCTRWRNKKTKMSQVGVLQRPALWSEGSRLFKKLDLHRTPLAKKCCHVDNYVMFFHSCLKFSTE